MEHIEDTKPIDVLASMVWSGTCYTYPHIEQMAAGMRELRARAEKAEKERDALRGVVVTVDTPNEVCDGTYAATLGTIIDAYGTEALGWLTNQECDWKRRAEKVEALYTKATFALDGWKQADTCDPMVKGECIREARERTDAHDAARKEAGL